MENSEPGVLGDLCGVGDLGGVGDLVLFGIFPRGCFNLFKL